MSRVIKDLVKSTLNNKSGVCQSSEAAFSDKYVMPFIRRALIGNADDKTVLYSMYICLFAQ